MKSRGCQRHTQGHTRTRTGSHLPTHSQGLPPRTDSHRHRVGHTRTDSHTRSHNHTEGSQSQPEVCTLQLSPSHTQASRAAQTHVRSHTEPDASKRRRADTQRPSPHTHIHANAHSGPWGAGCGLPDPRPRAPAALSEIEGLPCVAEGGKGCDYPGPPPGGARQGGRPGGSEDTKGRGQ